MSENTIIKPTDPVEIDLGDGVTRHLRYSLGSMRRLKKKFGTSMLSPEALLGLDEDKLADLIHEGIIEKDGLPLEAMTDLIDTRRLKQIIESFSLAFSGSLPEKNGTSQTATTIQ
jgi:hypothetical protein